MLYVIQIAFDPSILVSIMRPSYRELKGRTGSCKEAQARIAVPFSRDEKKAEPKRLGPRPGQGRFSYLKSSPEEEPQDVRFPCPAVPTATGPCGTDLSTSRSRSTYPK